MSGESTRVTVVHCFTEFVATLLFVYIGCGSCASSYYTEKLDVDDIVGVDSARLLVIAFAHGFAILLLVFATAHVSGGHINPVVSLAMIITGNISWGKGLMYMACQFLGGIFGGLLLLASISDTSNFGAHNLGNGVTPIGGIIIEFMLTFVSSPLFFCPSSRLFLFNTAVHSGAPSKLAPLAIGLAVLVDHLVGVPFTGASMNPARTLAAAVVYFIGPPLGAIAAGLSYQYGVLFNQKTLSSESERLLLNSSR